MNNREPCRIQSCRSLNATQPSGSHDKCHKLTPVNLTSLATHQNNASCASHTSVLCSPPQSCSEFHQPPTTTYDGISFDKTADLKRFHSHSLAPTTNSLHSGTVEHQTRESPRHGVPSNKNQLQPHHQCSLTSKSCASPALRAQDTSSNH